MPNVIFLAHCPLDVPVQLWPAPLPNTPAQIPFYKPGLVFGILDPTIPALAMHAGDEEQSQWNYSIKYCLEITTQLSLKPSRLLLFSYLLYFVGKCHVIHR